MGANAEGKISLSVELQNFKNIAGNLKKGLTQELKQIPLDVKFDNKDLEEQAAAAIVDINKMFTKTKLKNLDFSSILPAFVNEINRGDISDATRLQVIEGFKAGLENLKNGGLKESYTKLKGFSADELMNYFLDSNTAEDILNSFKGLSKRQKQGLRSSVLPSLSELKGRGWDVADKEYTKGAKRLEALMKLSGDYGDVLQYGTNPTATKNIISELDKRFKSGNMSKNDAQDVIGYLLRSDFLGIDIKEELKNQETNPTDLMNEAKNILGDSADTIIEKLKERAQAFFTAYDNIFNSTAKKITYKELLEDIENTTNKKFLGLYNAEASNVLEEVDVGKLFKESVKIKSDEKPELRKREKKEDVKDTTRTKPHSEEELKEFEFDDEEDKIQDYNTEIQKLDNRLNELDKKLDELSDKATRLRKEIPEEEKKLNDLNTQINNKQVGFDTKKKRDSKRLSDLNERKEGLENQNKDIDEHLKELQKKREDLANKLTALKKEEDELYKIPNEQLDQWYKKEAEESYIKDIKREKLIPQQLELKADEEALNRTYETITSKRELQKLLKEKLEEIKNINKEIEELFAKAKDESLTDAERWEAGSIGRDKLDVRSRLNLDYSRIYKQAIKQGVNEKTLNKYYNEGSELDDLAIVRPDWSLDAHNGAEQDNIDLVEEQLKNRKERIQEIEKEIEEEEKILAEIIQKLNGFDYNKIKERKNEIPKEQKNIEKEITENNDKIFEQEFAKKRNISLLKGTQIDIDELQSQDYTEQEQQLQQLKRQRDEQKKIYDEKKQANIETLNQMNQVEQQMNKIQDKRDELIQKQKELNKQEEERKKEEKKANEQKSKTNKLDSETENESKETGTSGTSTSSNFSIPPEKLQEILTLLGNIQKALGTLEDGSDIPSITQSVKNMADALKELSEALGEIKQKDFNFNIGLPNNNPIGQKGEIKRKVIKELQLQYDEFMKFFGGAEGLIASAKKYSLSQSEHGDIGEQIINQYLIPKQFDTSTLVGQIDELQYKLSMLFQFSKEKGLNLDEILSNSKNPSEIIKQISEDIVNTNPVAAISKIFEDIKISIDASMAQINTESKGFNFLSGSAEEAAEAKRKFVEANKDVLQSIVASMPKIEQEAEALEKIEEIQTKKNTTKNTKTKEDNIKIEDRKGYYDFEAMPNELIEQRFGELSPLPVIAKGVSLATNKLKEETQSSVELLENLHSNYETELQKAINEFSEDSTGQLSLFDNVLPEKNWGQELKQNIKDVSEAVVEGQISFQQLEDAEQRVIEQYNKIRSTKDFIQGEDVSEKFLETYEGISTERIQELFKTFQELKQVKASLQDSFDENGNLIEDPLQAKETYDSYIRLVDIVKKLKTEISGQYSEETIALKLKQDAEKAEEELNNLIVSEEKAFEKIRNSKTFIQGKDINDNYLKQFGDTDSTKNLDILKQTFEKLENIKFQLKLAFDEEGKLLGDPTQVQLLLDRYDFLTQKIERLKMLIESPNSEENILKDVIKDEEKTVAETEKLTVLLEKAFSKLTNSEKITTSIEKFLQPYFDLPITDTVDQMINTVARIQDISNELSSSFNKQGELIGDPRRVQELIIEYNNLIKQIDELKAKISSPLSQENIALELAKEAEKAKEKVKETKEELDELKNKITSTFDIGKSDEILTSKTEAFIKSYGSLSDKNNINTLTAPVEGSGFEEQQSKVIALREELKKYKEAVEELKQLKNSDIVDLSTLTEADKKVKNLETSINAMMKSIRANASGNLNASTSQVDKFARQIEAFMIKNPRITLEAKKSLNEYLQTLKSGESISKTALGAMADGFAKLKIEQEQAGKLGYNIWDQMILKMREGVAFLATKFSFYQIFNQFRQGITIVKEFDDALTEMQKVSDETMLTLQRYQKTTFNVAESIGSTALQVQQSTADFLRLGESLEEAAKSAKAANVLMNVSEFESINDATTSLIALSAAYDDLTKENIIDKLNEVGNNYSISTSGAAEALQMSASALKTAQNDMNEALALVTAGNQVVQDISKAGNGLRTIALRLTGTKSAKEELEEMGEETENVITTQSKLRDVIKEATAVESNAFKGFDILNDNGNYKSTYEIMLGIAQIYDEIVETDKKLGRNNVNLLLETVAGKTRANVAASIFQSPDILQKAYASSISANGSAQEENQKYLESISGHLAQLQSKWQEVWSKTANREIINFFIDLGKGILEVVDKIGLIPSALMVLVPYFEIIRTGATNSKGFITILLEALSTLNEVEEASNVIKAESETISLLRAASTQVENEALRQQIEACIEAAVAEEAKNAISKESTALSLLKKASLEVENKELKETIENYIKLAEAEGLEAGVANAAAGSKGVGLLANKFDLLKRAASGLKTAIVGLLGETGAMLATLGVGAAAIAGIAIAVNNHMREEAIANAQEVTESLNKQDESLQKQIDSYEELKTKLDSGDLSEKETLETKQQIYDIQKQITEEYGTAAQGVDLVNGKLKEQVSLLNTISQKEAQTMYSQNYEGFEAAIDEYTKDRKYGFSLSSSSKEIQDALNAAGMRVYGSGSGTFMAQIKDDATSSIKSLEKAKVNLEELKEQYKNTETEGIIDNEIRKIDKAIGEAYEDADEYKDTALRGLELRLLSRDQNGYGVFENYQSSVSNLENAYISGDTKKIEETRKAFEEATIAKNKFLSIPSNNQFSLLFDNIDTSLIKTKNQIYDATEAVKKAKEINTELDRINNYKEQKKQADAFYNSLGNLQKVGNIDNGNRPIIFWDNEELKEQQKAIESWGETIEDFKDSMSTVYGGSGSFDGVEIAFTPIINDGTGKGKLLTKETLYKYIDTLIGNAGEGWTNESLLKLDAEGLVIDGQKISNVLGAVGSSMSNVGLTAVQVGEMMHDWQAGSLGYISEFKDEWQEAIEQGESLEEHMQNREKDLLGTSKATDKYTKNEIKLAKALREVTRLDMDRVDAEMVFDENAKSSETYRNALYNLMDALGWASDAHASFIDWAVDVGLIQGTVTDALNAASVSYNDYASAVATATENLELLQTVLTESDSGKGLSTTTLDQFKEAFGDDAVLALEKTANGIRANRDAIRELGAQQDESLRTTQLQALNDQYTALQKVYEGYENALHNGDPTTPFIQQEEAIRNEINNLELLQAEWRGTTSAYQAWLNAQSNSNPQDMYANVISGYETVEDLIARGWWTDESVRNYLDLVLADDFDAQIAGANELKEGFESLDKTIQGTSFSIHDFFMTDESGNIAVDGLNNFEDALKQVQDKYYPDKNWLTYEDGKAIFDFRNGGNKEVADALGIGTELLDIFISAMESAGGFEVKLDTDDAKENLKQLKEEAANAKESLDLDEKINLDPSNIKEADESINNINTIIEEIKNKDEIDLETKTDQLEEANKILEYLIENKNQLIQSSFGEEGIRLIDIGELEAADNKLQKILNRPIKGGFDFSEFDFNTAEGLTAAQDAINDMLVAPNVDDSQIQYLNELLDIITEKLEIINGIGSGTDITLGEYKALDEAVTSVKQQIQEGQDAANKGFHISWSSDEDFYNTLDAINNLDPEIKTAFGLIPDKTTEQLIDMVENGETIFVETKTRGVTPAPVQDETRTITTQENVKLGVTTIGAEPAQDLIQDLNIHDGQEFNMYMEAHANTEEANSELDKTIAKGEEAGNLQPEAEVTADNSQANNAIDEAAQKMSDFNGTTSWGYIRIDAGNSVNIIDSLTQGIKDIPTYKRTVIETVEKTTKAGKANGTAHVQGTAFVKGSIVSGNAFTGGKWGIPQDQTALTGELGTEIVVRDGNWFTVGEDGAEFVDLQKGDIVFNHKQAQELLENGYVTSNKGRGKLVGFANGSAFCRGTMLSGPAYGGDSAKRTRTTSSVTTKKVGKKTTKGTTTGKGSGGGGNGNGNGGGGGGTTNKEANKTKNTLDEVEILIARIERQIANLDKTISSTYKTWSTRNAAIKSDLTKVAKEIKEQSKAYTTYMRKANSIQIATDKNADGSTKSAKDKKKQSDTWKKRIQNGQQIIRDISNQDVWDKIQEYKQW